MLGRRFWVILSLVMLVIELLDPTTPFIRLACESAAKRNQSFMSKRRSVSKLTVVKSTASDSDEKDTDNDQSPTEELDQVDYHSAISVAGCILAETVFESNWTRSLKGLQAQFRPPTRKRPPIS